MGRALRIRLICAGTAFVGTAVPLLAATRWPTEIIFVTALLVGLVVPLALYVLLIRTRAMSIVTGCALAAVGVGLPVPGYPQFFTGSVGRWGFALLIVPPLCLAIWLIGQLIDLVVRADRRLGDAGGPGDARGTRRGAHRGTPTAARLPSATGGPGAIGTGMPADRPGVAVGRARAPGIVVRYLPADGVEPDAAPERATAPEDAGSPDRAAPPSAGAPLPPSAGAPFPTGVTPGEPPAGIGPPDRTWPPPPDPPPSTPSPDPPATGTNGRTPDGADEPGPSVGPDAPAYQGRLVIEGDVIHRVDHPLD